METAGDRLTRRLCGSDRLPPWRGVGGSCRALGPLHVMLYSAALARTPMAVLVHGDTIWFCSGECPGWACRVGAGSLAAPERPGSACSPQRWKAPR